MATKPHRLLDRVSGYADEAAAFLRRRRHMRKPFARVYYRGGRGRDLPADSASGRAMFEATAKLIEVAGPPRRIRQARSGSNAARRDR